MNKISVILLLFTISVSYSQQKREYYFDEKWRPLTLQEFLKKQDHKVNLATYTQNDTAVIAKLHTRSNYGILSPDKLKIVYGQLERISGKIYDRNKIIVINYYSGLDKYYPAGMSQWNIYDRDYLKKLEKIANFQQYYVYKYEDNLRYHHGKRLNWLKDENAIIERNFFPYHFNYGSCVVICPNGNYYVYYGEYGKTTVWEAVEKMVKENKL